MQKSIERFVSENQNGLYLIDIPTGIGKTTQAIEYIYNHIDEDKKFFYITSLNKNVDSAFKDLYDLFKKNNRLDVFEKNCIRLYSNSEKVIDEICNISYNPEDALIKYDSFKELVNQVKIYNKIKDSTSFESAELLDRILKDIKEKFEPTFRHEVESYLKDKGNKKEKLQYIKDNHGWLIKLYPSIYTSYRKVFFLSIDKFYLGNSTLIEPAYKFINKNDLYSNAIIFIDEIDAAKDTILNRQIEESMKNSINVFKLFIDIRNALNYKKFPKEMLKSSKRNSDDSNRQKKILLEMKRIFDADFDAHNMQYSFKTLEKDLKRKYVFDDGTYSTIAQDKDQKEIYVVKNSNENYNHLIFQEKEDATKLNKVLATINGAIKYFLNGIYLLAINYRDYYNENKNANDDAMQYDDAVQSIVKAFNIETNMIPYVCNLVTGNISTKHRYNTSFSTSIYDSGFRYYYFEDNINNNLSTNVRMYNLYDTPESFILNLAQKTWIVGLSATSTLETVTGNFDILYLKQHLGNNFFVPTLEEKIRIDKFVDDVIETNKSKINVSIIKSDDIEESIKQLFVTEDYQDWLKGKLSNITEDTKDFKKHRFLKVGLTIKKFCIEEKGRSILILSSKNLSEKNNELYSKNNINELLKLIIKENKLTDEFSIINLVTKNFEEMKKEYQKLINDKKRVIIFSSYPTTGAGQNLQYEILNESLTKRSKEDIDSIYVENPTNLLVLTNDFNENNEADLIKYIFQIESLRTSGEISLNDKFAIIKEGFMRMVEPFAKVPHYNPYDTNSVRNHGLRVLIQAIGRICRVRGKSKDTNIYIDSTVIEKIDLSVAEGRRLNKEFTKVLETFKKNNVVKNDELFFLSIKKAQNDSKLMADIIHNYISRNEWAESIMLEWKKLREQVLKYPTANYDELGEFGLYSNCYLKSEEYEKQWYYYKQEDDYGSVKISMKNMGGYSAVSEIDSLEKIMTIDVIKNHFIEKGYATQFEQNNYVMLPIIYNNIYKGALGEEAGLVLFEKYIGIKLEEIRDGKKFEKFDFVYNDYYVDFKFWQDTPNASVDLEKFNEKIKLVEAKKAFVINILGNSKDRISEFDKLIIIPSLIDEDTKKININALKRIAQIIRGGE